MEEWEISVNVRLETAIMVLTAAKDEAAPNQVVRAQIVAALDMMRTVLGLLAIDNEENLAQRDAGTL